MTEPYISLTHLSDKCKHKISSNLLKSFNTLIACHKVNSLETWTK